MENRIDWPGVEPLLAEVKAMASHLLALEHGPRSLQTTELVVSALRRQKRTDQDWPEVTWENRKSFFGAVYTAMRRALIDHGRSRARERERVRSAVVQPTDLRLDDLPQIVREEPDQLAALAEALTTLQDLHADWGEAVQHRFFAGYSTEEIARVMGTTDRTVRRWLQRARVLLADEILRRLNETQCDVRS